MKVFSIRAVGMMVVALLIPASVQAGGIWDNGGGDGLWETPANWNLDTLPGATDDVGIPTPNVANLSSTQSVKGINSSGTLNILTGGNLTAGASHVQTGSSVFTLNVLGGSITASRFFNNPTASTSVNSGMIITMTGGAISFNDRFQFNSFAVDNDRNVVNLSGGTFGSANFTLFGAYNGNRSQLNVTGSTLAFNVAGITLAPITSDPAISTALTFTVAGTTLAERSTIAKLNTVGGLVLDQNPLTVDFSNYANAGTGSYSMTLIDYAGVLTLPSGTAFAAPNFIYGSSGVSGASLVLDATNKLYRVDFSYAAIPEPATLGLLVIGGLMMLPRRGR